MILSLLQRYNEFWLRCKISKVCKTIEIMAIPKRNDECREIEPNCFAQCSWKADGQNGGAKAIEEGREGNQAGFHLGKVSFDPVARFLFCL